MIRTFAHKGLERYFRTGATTGIQAIHAKRLRLILAMLEQAKRVEDVDLPGLRLHSLSGNLQGQWAVTVQANWRVTFRFSNGDAHLVNYLDYH